MEQKRNVDLVVLSDLHLGTAGCQANELLKYLKSIRPKILVLNGDIVDIWQFRKRFFPKSHLKVIKHLLGLASSKTSVYYITGNHDELFRKFNGFKIGKLKVVNDLKLKLGEEQVWFFHGDIFDVVMQYSKWLAKLGAVGYDTLIWMNTTVNQIYGWLGFEPVSFSRKIKHSVKSAVKYINSFEQSAAEVAAARGFDTIVCGHIHQSGHREILTKNGSVNYLNSGDWIENLTSLEYHNGDWRVFHFRTDFSGSLTDQSSHSDQLVDSEPKQLFMHLVREFKTSAV